MLVDSRRGKVILIGLSVLTVAINGVPLLPVGLLVALYLVFQAGASFGDTLREQWTMILGCIAAFVVTFFLLPIGLDIVMQPTTGTIGIGISTRPLGGIRGIEEMIQKRRNAAEMEARLVEQQDLAAQQANDEAREMLERPRWISWDFLACPGPDEVLSKAGPECERTVLVEGGTRFETIEVIGDTPEDRRLRGKVETPGGQRVLEVWWEPHEEEAVVIEDDPATLERTVRNEFAEAVANEEVRLAMSSTEVKMALGLPSSHYPIVLDNGERIRVYEYVHGPIVLIHDSRRVVVALYDVSERRAAQELCEALDHREKRPMWKGVYPEFQLGQQAVQLNAKSFDATSFGDVKGEEMAWEMLREASRLYEGTMKSLILKDRLGLYWQESLENLRSDKPLPIVEQ